MCSYYESCREDLGKHTEIIGNSPFIQDRITEFQIFEQGKSGQIYDAFVMKFIAHAGKWTVIHSITFPLILSVGVHYSLLGTVSTIRHCSNTVGVDKSPYLDSCYR